jgi:DNA repair/transcription protein MET18/MMS19
MKDLMARLAFIGCSKPSDPTSTSSQSPLGHFITLTGALLQTTEVLLQRKANPAVIAFVLSGINGAARNLNDACPPVPKQGLSGLEFASPANWVQEFRAATVGSNISSDWAQLLASQCDERQAAVSASAATTESSLDVRPRFTRLTLFIIRHLYRRFTQETVDGTSGESELGPANELLAYYQQQLSPEPIMYQLANMASFIIRSLDAAAQRSLNLAIQAFQLFGEPAVKSSYRKGEGHELLNILTLGILESLWPDSMVELVRI